MSTESNNGNLYSRILVVGDLMLDRYTFGDAEPVSPEVPIVVLTAVSEKV